MVNVIKYCEVPYEDCKIFRIRTVQVNKSFCRVMEAQRWKSMELKVKYEDLEGLYSELEMLTGLQKVHEVYRKKSGVLRALAHPKEIDFSENLYIIEFLRNNKPTKISKLIRRPRRDFKNFVCDVNLLAEYIVRYIRTVDNRSVFPDVYPGFLDDQLNMDNLEKPMKLEEILKDFETKILPGNSHWNHVNFRSYFASHNFASAALADLAIGSIYAVLCNWAMGPSGVEFELQMVEEYGKMMGIPEIFWSRKTVPDACGVTLSATSEGVMMAMLTAKELMLNKLSSNRKERFEVASKLVAYVSEQAHSCHERATKLSNVECHLLETDENGSMRGPILEAAIKKDIKDGKIPFFLSLSLGTTGIIAFDNLKENGKICEEYDLWIHADLAYSCSALICPEYRYIIEDLEKVSSLSCNLYKWIGLNVGVSLFYTKRGREYKNAFSMNPDYLNYDGQEESKFRYDHMDTSVTLSRPCRGIKLWFHIRLNGLNMLQSIVRKHCQLAKYFAELLSEDDRFELFRLELSVAVFRYKLGDSFNDSLQSSLTRSGDMYLTLTHFKEKTYLRFLVGAPDETKKDVEKGWRIIRKHTTRLEKQQKEAPIKEEVATVSGNSEFEERNPIKEEMP